MFVMHILNAAVTGLVLFAATGKPEYGLIGGAAMLNGVYCASGDGYG